MIEYIAVEKVQFMIFLTTILPCLRLCISDEECRFKERGDKKGRTYSLVGLF